MIHWYSLQLSKQAFIYRISLYMFGIFLAIFIKVLGGKLLSNIYFRMKSQSDTKYNWIHDLLMKSHNIINFQGNFKFRS